MRRSFKKGLAKAHHDGLVSMPTIDRAVSNVLRSRFRVGLFDSPEVVPYSQITAEVIGSPEHEKLAYRAAQESLVLLKNDAVSGKPLLPVDRKAVRLSLWSGLMRQQHSWAIIAAFHSILQ